MPRLKRMTLRAVPCHDGKDLAFEDVMTGPDHSL